MASFTKLSTFYTSDKYRRFRAALIAERGPVCQRCGKLMSEPLDIILHHTPIELTIDNVDDPNVSLNPGNAKIVCFECHQAEHQRYGNDDTRHVYIVYGPPLAGKTTLVMQQARRGDLIVDIDRIYEALSLMPIYDKPNNLFSIVACVRDLLLDNIKTRYGKWRNAWVIGGYPEKHAREALAEALGAELIYCPASREECFARLAGDSNRSKAGEQWTGFIDSWFARFTA